MKFGDFRRNFGQVELLAATAGKRMTKRQLHDAMVAMDTDGSGEVRNNILAAQSTFRLLKAHFMES